MKTQRKRLPILILLLSLSLLLFGCNTVAATQEPHEDAEKTALARRVSELEATLQAEREASYIRENELATQISELEERLALLTGGAEGEKPEGAAMVFHYTVENGLATVTKYEGAATLVEIPQTLDGYPVTAIGERAFEGNTSIAAVVVPDGVKVINWFAFYGCGSLFDITLPASITSIGHAVFDGCAGPTVTCPKGSYAAEYAKSYGLSCIET